MWESEPATMPKVFWVVRLDNEPDKYFGPFTTPEAVSEWIESRGLEDLATIYDGRRVQMTKEQCEEIQRTRPMITFTDPNAA
jgi:hypothetical protein